jgi:hypothetical protein
MTLSEFNSPTASNAQKNRISRNGAGARTLPVSPTCPNPAYACADRSAWYTSLKTTLTELGDMLTHVVKHMATKDDIARRRVDTFMVNVIDRGMTGGDRNVEL